MLKDIYIRLKDWEKLDHLLPELEKYRIAVDNQAVLEAKIAVHRLKLVQQSSGGHVELTRQWKALPKKIRYNEPLIIVYLEKLISFSRHDDAMTEAVSYLKHSWSDAVVELIGTLDVSDAGQQLVQLEKWIKSRPNNGALMLSLGRASLRNSAWPQAREYFESARRFAKDSALSATANAELARLLEHMGDHEKSAACYGRAMELLEHKLPALPLPERH